jgi:hypothetical protein
MAISGSQGVLTLWTASNFDGGVGLTLDSHD